MGQREKGGSGGEEARRWIISIISIQRTSGQGLLNERWELANRFSTKRGGRRVDTSYVNFFQPMKQAESGKIPMLPLLVAWR